MRRTTRGRPLAYLGLLLAASSASSGGDAPAPPGGDLVGRILVNGVPTAGTVEVRRRPERPERPLETGPALETVASDPTGGFRVGNLAVGRYEVRSVVPGAVPGFSEAFVPGATDVEVPVAVPGGSHRLRGRIAWDDGSPFRGVVGISRWPHATFGRVHATARAESFAETDADGRFAFDGVAAGLFRLDVYVPPSHRETVWDVRVPTDEAAAVVIGDSDLVHRGRVVDAATDRPIRATVRSEAWSGTATFEADAEGRFTARSFGATQRIVVSADGYAPKAMSPWDSKRQIVVKMARGTTLEGRVLDEAGKPAAGIPVYAVLKTGPSSRDVREALSDGEGRYRIEHLGDDERVVFALGAGWMATSPGPWTEIGEDLHRVRLGGKPSVAKDLHVARAGSLRVRVKDAGGKAVPFPTASVRGERLTGSFLIDRAFEGVRLARGNADGVVEFPTVITSEALTLSVHAQGLARVGVRSLTPMPGSVTPVDATFSAPRWFDVLVVDDAGPVVGAMVSGMLPPNRPPNSVVVDLSGDAFFDRGDVVLANGEGKARVGPFPAGLPGIDVDSDVHHPMDARLIESTGPTTVRLARAATISGKVLGPKSLLGRPVRVTIGPAGSAFGWWVDAVTVPAGLSFATPPLRGEKYELKASVDVGDRYYEAKAEAKAGATDVVLRLEPAKKEKKPR